MLKMLELAHQSFLMCQLWIIYQTHSIFAIPTTAALFLPLPTQPPHYCHCNQASTDHLVPFPGLKMFNGSVMPLELSPKSLASLQDPLKLSSNLTLQLYIWASPFSARHQMHQPQPHTQYCLSQVPACLSTFIDAITLYQKCYSITELMMTYSN